MFRVNESESAQPEIRKLGWGFGRCNQQCKHCYNASKPQAPEFTFQELKAVADKVGPFVSDINFGTGEFVVNPNTHDLGAYLRDAYPRVNLALTTNGYSVVALRPETIKALFHDVDVSLDFPDAERHNAFRVHPKAWAWVHEALEILRDQAVPRSVVTCVTSQTTDDDIVGLLEIARRYGATWRINWFRHVGRGTSDLRLTAARAWEIVRLLSELDVAFLTLDSVFAGALGVSAQPCPAGHHTCRVHENMETSCYPFLKGAEWSGGNILEVGVTLASIYESEAFKRLRARQVPACAGCPFQSTCQGGCVTRAALHNGSISEVDDFCPIAAGLDVDALRAIRIRKGVGDLVHDGYLCTTIVDPNSSATVPSVVGTKEA